MKPETEKQIRLTKDMKSLCIIAIVVPVLCCVLEAEELAPSDKAVKGLAKHIVQSSGINVGLCVHLGCTDGKLTADLAEQGKFVVHGLVSTQKETEKARQHIASRNMHGAVSVEHGSLSRLPYMDNLVNLVVVDNLTDALKDGLSLKEVMRVLCPNGVAYIGDKTGAPKEDNLKSIVEKAGIKDFEIMKQNGLWAKIRKPRPKEMDEWTHWLHGPECNNHSSDSLIGPAERMQWINGPVWMKGRNITELFAHGRSFNLQHDRIRSTTQILIARDAFNGLEFWRRDIGTSNPRLVVAVGERVFTVLKKNGPVVALDAATGKEAKTYDVGISPLVVFCIDGHLIIGTEKEICSVNAETGKERWKKRAPEGASFALQPSDIVPRVLYKPPYMVSGNGQLFVYVKNAPKPPYSLVSYDLANGKEKWKKKQPGEILAFYKKIILLYEVKSTTKPRKVRDANETGTYHAVSPADGSLLWSHPHQRATGHGIWNDPYYSGNLVWIINQSFDLMTGEKRGEIKARPNGHCARTITTEHYILPKMGSIISFETGRFLGSNQYKNGCNVGKIPANGLIYTFPISCSCIAYIRGFVAFAPAGKEGKAKIEKTDRFEKGPAYGFKPQDVKASANSEWPTYRRDSQRSSSTTETMDANIKTLWSKTITDQEKTPFGKTITPPVIAEGMLLVAAPDTHQVCALDTETGTLRWQYLLDGRVEVPPTIYKGLCLFGANDGWVYCLRMKDGKLVWRFRAAPKEQRIMAYRRLESPWPVPGVMVENGVAYFAAGRHSKCDEGIYAYAVNPFTGKILWQKRVDKNEERGWADNFVNDLLVSDGKSIFMTQMIFNLKTGEKSRNWTKRDIKYKYNYLLSGCGRDTNAVIPFGFLYDRKDGTGLQRYHAAHWAYRGARGLIIAFTSGKVFGVAEERSKQIPWKIYARKFSDNTRMRLAQKMSQENFLWSVSVPRGSVQALLPAGETLFVTGKGKSSGVLSTYSAENGKKLSKLKFDDPPIFDGMAAANGRIYISTQKGKVFCFGK